jgi:hypothetical protein
LEFESVDAVCQTLNVEVDQQARAENAMHFNVTTDDLAGERIFSIILNANRNQNSRSEQRETRRSGRAASMRPWGPEYFRGPVVGARWR